MSYERFVIPTPASEVLAVSDLRKNGLNDLLPRDFEDSCSYVTPHEQDPGTPLHPVMHQPLTEPVPDFTQTTISPETSYPKSPLKTM